MALLQNRVSVHHQLYFDQELGTEVVRADNITMHRGIEGVRNLAYFSKELGRSTLSHKHLDLFLGRLKPSPNNVQTDENRADGVRKPERGRETCQQRGDQRGRIGHHVVPIVRLDGLQRHIAFLPTHVPAPEPEEDLQQDHDEQKNSRHPSECHVWASRNIPVVPQILARLLHDFRRRQHHDRSANDDPKRLNARETHGVDGTLFATALICSLSKSLSYHKNRLCQ
mmetsp:Transcript_11315/g.31512  ORF Transcript_11315/g.31512 Transcript_11315/m.31512 type:complete len:226 (+) Transcript_11315:317-994(+)